MNKIVILDYRKGEVFILKLEDNGNVEEQVQTFCDNNDLSFNDIHFMTSNGNIHII